MFIVHFKHAFQTYLEPYQTSAMEPFRNNSKRLEFLKYFRKSSKMFERILRNRPQISLLILRECERIN